MKAYSVLFSLALALIMPHAQASLLSASGSNTPSSVQINSPGTSIIQWQVVKNIPRPNTVKVVSSVGTFKTASGRVLQRSSTEIVDTLRAATAGSYTFTLNETLLIPLSVIREVQAQGDNRFFYERNFFNSEDSSQKSASVQFTIQSTDSIVISPPSRTINSSPAAASSSPSSGSTSPNAENTSPIEAPTHLRIDRLQLRYDDNRRSAIVDTDSELGAYAILNYSGSGVIRYTWEIATPPSTAGQASFHPLETRLQHLLAGGKVTISSPYLPTQRTGEYLLRLKISHPNPTLTTDAMRYAVKANSQAPLSIEVSPIATAHPALKAFVSPDTEFRWQAIPGATAYQLEIYDTPQINDFIASSLRSKPITGVIIPAHKTSLTLGAAPWAHLKISQQYFWRVIALSNDGHIIGRSTLKEMQTP